MTEMQSAIGVRVRMSDLIAEHCPTGVVHYALADVASYSNTRIHASELDVTNFVGVDNLLPNKGGKTDASYPPNTARLTAYESGDVLLGNIRPYLKKVWLATGTGGCSGDVLAIRISPAYRKAIDPHFLYYVLSSDGFFAYNMKNAKGAKMPRGNKDAIMRYRVPVPPLLVQREIVRILDQFTKLQMELEAELTARHSQRAALAINFAVFARAQMAWESVALGSIAQPSIEPVKVDPDEEYINLGVKWYGEGVIARDPRPGNSIKTATLYRVSAGDFIYNRMFVVEGSFAIVPENCDGTVVSSEFPLYKLDTSRVDPFWLIQYFKDEHVLKRIEAEVTGVERGSMKSRRRWKQEQFAKFEILLPPLDVQRESASVLGSSDALIGALQDEIRARRMQFEYYRDRLLTFQEIAG